MRSTKASTVCRFAGRAAGYRDAPLKKPEAKSSQLARASVVQFKLANWRAINSSISRTSSEDPMQVGVAGSALNHRSKELSFGIATIEPASLAAWRCPPL